jgi:Na+/H+ antiporter NhaD/arsenite permease-like protein
VVITAAASALLDNVTTVLLVAPVTILICQRLRLPAIPYLIAEVLASNIGGTATLIGDPPNIIIASRAGLSFNDFLMHLTPIVLVLMVVLLGLCRWLFAGAFRTNPRALEEIMALREGEAIRDRRLLVISLSVLGLVLAAFVLHPVLHYEPSVVALLGAGLLVTLTRVGTRTALQDVEWETLAFFMGLFVMIGGLVKAGVLSALANAITSSADTRGLGFTMVLLLGSGVLSAVVDNIPYVASMSPVVAGLVDPSGEPRVLWWALALGADLGGNATLIGASANIVMAGVAARNGVEISFWRFTRYGLVVTAATLLVSAVYVALRYFVLA